MRAWHSGSETSWGYFPMPETLLFCIHLSCKEASSSGVFSRTKNIESQSDLSKQAYHIYHHRLLNQPRTQNLDQIWLQRNTCTASTLHFLLLHSKKKEGMWEGAENDVAYLWTRYLRKKEMSGVTAIFAASGLKRGLTPVAVNAIFSTGCWHGLPLVLMDTLVASFCGFTNHTLAFASAWEGPAPHVTFTKSSWGPSRERAPYHWACYAFGIHNLGYSHMRPHDLVFLEERSGYRQIWCRALPAAVCHKFTPSVAANAVLTACQLQSCQPFHKGGDAEPAGWSLGTCSRITSSSAFWFRWLSTLGKGAGRRAKGILVRAKLCLVPYFKKLLIFSPHPKVQKNTVDSLMFLLFTKRQGFSLVLSSKNSWKAYEDLH